MKIEQIEYSIPCVEQLIYFYNKKYNLKIKYDVILKAGTPFVTYELNDNIDPSVLFEFAYHIGNAQAFLQNEEEDWLPLKRYPLPPDDYFEKL